MLGRRENKKKVGYMLSTITLKQLAELKKETNYSKAVLIERAVDELYKNETNK
jgi:hypothetical protein